jgi:hypothetical protein
MINLTFRHLMGAATIAILSTLHALRAEKSFVPTGVEEIDAMRRDLSAHPTTPENASRRHALIFSWVRLLVHRGVDMADFHDACAKFSAWGPIDSSRYGAMEGAFRALEKIQSNPSFSEEVRGTRERPSPAKHAGSTASASASRKRLSASVETKSSSSLVMASSMLLSNTYNLKRSL